MPNPTRTIPLAAALLCAGCAVLPARHDVSDLPPGDAMDAALDRLEATYAFTEHKRLDWNAAREALSPRAHAATAPHEVDDAIRHLVPWLPDAHVQLFNHDADRDLCPEAAGWIGITLSDLDDGRVLVAHSAAPGLEAGDIVTHWNDVPITQAREDAAIHCFPLGMATRERRRQVALRALTRAPIDTVVTVGIERDGITETVDTHAEADTDDVRAAFDIELPPHLLESRELEGGIAYIKVGWEETFVTETRFQRLLAGFSDAPALVLDLRDNDGGMERTAANLAGFFTQERAFYETVTFLNNRTLEQDVISRVYVEPQELYWARPVAVLIDADTVSSGEGLTLLMSRVPHAEIVGFEGTAASFGSTGSTLALPGGWTLAYPGGQSLDIDDRIQLDSDHTLEGGVVPTLRVPWTLDNRVRHAAGEDVVLEHALAHLVSQ